MSKIGGWFAATGAALALGIALLLWSVAPASECTTPQQVQWWAGLAPFCLSVVAGGYTALRGTAAQRLLLLVVSAVLVAGYVWALSRSLPIVIDTEVTCAASGAQ